MSHSKRNRIRRTNKHHRRSRSRTGGVPFNGVIEGIQNIIVVDYRKHQAFHTLFPDTHPEEVAKSLTEVWCDPGWIVCAVPREHARAVVKLLKQFT